MTTLTQEVRAEDLVARIGEVIAWRKFGGVLKSVHLHDTATLGLHFGTVEPGTVLVQIQEPGRTRDSDPLRILRLGCDELVTVSR